MTTQIGGTEADALNSQLLHVGMAGRFTQDDAITLEGRQQSRLAGIINSKKHQVAFLLVQTQLSAKSALGRTMNIHPSVFQSHLTINIVKRCFWSQKTNRLAFGKKKAERTSE